MMKEITEWGKDFLVLDEEQDFDEFALQMLRENNICGLLAVEKRVFNGEEKLYYDISGKLPLLPKEKEGFLTGQDIRMLMQSLCCLILELHAYFLEPQGILLQFEMIYKADETYFFCYNPVISECDIRERNLSAFVEDLLEYTDHEDAAAVFLSYEFYNRIKEGKNITQSLEEVLSLSLEKDSEENRPMEEAEENDILTENFGEEEAGEKEVVFDMVTFVVFAVLFLVSLGYLLFMYFGEKNIKFFEITQTKNGLLSLIFLALSILGMFVGTVHRIDIKEKK
nr:hypothetical protein [Lachnospiraceae bacterium]